MPERLTYRAFLSYSHRDKRKAKRWHARLESFQIDRLLVGRETPVGKVPENLVPVYRDRLDHPAGGSLDEVTAKALDRSDALVLIATPNAAKSYWVNEEVRLFRHRHPDRPLIVVLDAPRGASAEACMPPALRFALDADGQVTEERYTHLAADPRPGADGATGARAKVVSGLLGVDPLDVLPRIEAQLRRENQRFAWLTGGIAALVVVLGVGGWAIQHELQMADEKAGQRHAAVMDGQKKLERLTIDAAGGGAPAVQAIQAFRAIMRPSRPDIDGIPAEQMPSLMKSVFDTLSKPGANPNDYAGAIRDALATAQALNGKIGRAHV